MGKYTNGSKFRIYKKVLIYHPTSVVSNVIINKIIVQE